MDLHVEVSEVVFVGNSADAGHSGVSQASAGPCSCSCLGVKLGRRAVLP